jgi:hypothetical protein
MDYYKDSRISDPILWQGRILMFNIMSPRHLDARNPPAEWTPLHAAGSFTTGRDLIIWQLGLRLRYRPGDLVFIRGGILEHSVEDWGVGQRISAVYLTHKAFWNWYKLRLSLDWLMELEETEQEVGGGRVGESHLGITDWVYA